MNAYDDQYVPEDVNEDANGYEQEQTGVSDRKVSSEPVPGFPYYILAPRGATFAYEFDDKNRPVGRHRFEVIDGPAGTIGQTLFADQRLYWQTERWTPNKDAQGRNIMEPLTPEERAEAIRKFNATQERVMLAFGLQAKNPKNNSAVACGAYLAQFDKALNVVADVKRQTKNGFTKNVIWFDSIAGLEDTPLDGRFATALAEAQAKIAAKNKALESAAKKSGGGKVQATRGPQSASAPAID